MQKSSNTAADRASLEEKDGFDGEGSSRTGNLGRLYSDKMRRLKEQKDLAKELNDILTREGGLNDCSLQTRKSLEAAIALSQRPGNLNYFELPPEIKRIYDQGDLNLLTNKIRQKQREIDQIDAEIENEEKVQKSSLYSSSRPANAVNSLSQWFATYGEPKPPPGGQFTTFDADPKVYGGTAHHQAFKTLAKTMRKGRCTR